MGPLMSPVARAKARRWLRRARLRASSTFTSSIQRGCRKVEKTGPMHSSRPLQQVARSKRRTTHSKSLLMGSLKLRPVMPAGGKGYPVVDER